MYSFVTWFSHLDGQLELCNFLKIFVRLSIWEENNNGGSGFGFGHLLAIFVTLLSVLWLEYNPKKRVQGQIVRK